MKRKLKKFITFCLIFLGKVGLSLQSFNESSKSTAKNCDSIHVLLVDDELDALRVANSILQTKGDFKIDEATSVEEALKKIEEKKDYDVIVCDYKMPLRDGLDFLKQIKNLGIDIPFILFTGKGREEVAIQALNLGADGYYNRQGSTETVFGELAHGIMQAATRRKAKLALEESERRWRTLMEQAVDEIYVHDSNGNIIDANEQASKNTGYSKEELLRMNIREIAPSSKALGETWSKIVEGQTLTFEASERRKDGTVFPVEVAVGGITLGQRKLMLAVARNTSERKKVQQELAEKNRLAQTLLDAVPCVALLLKPDTREIIAANKAALEIGAVPGKHCFSTWGKRDSPCPWCLAPTLWSTQEPQHCVVNTKDVIWDAYWFPINKEVYMHYAFNITENKRVAQAREEKKICPPEAAEEDNYRLLIEAMQEGAILLSNEDNIFYCNSGFANIIRSSIDKIIGKTIYDFISGDSAIEFKELLKTARKRSESFAKEITLKASDNTPLLAYISANSITTKVRRTFLIVTDLTELKKAEEVLHYQSNLLSNVHEGIIGFSPTFNITYWNKGAEDIFGYTNEEVIGKYAGSVLQTSINQINQGSKNKRFEDILNQGFCEGEMDYTSKNGDKIVADIRLVTLKNYEGQLTGIVASIRNATDRKHQEEMLKLSHNKIKEVNDKLHVLGSLTRHDVRNKLMTIRNSVYLLKKQLVEKTEAQAIATSIDNAVSEADKLIEFSRLYEKMGTEQLRSISVEECFEEAASLFSNMTGINITNECQGVIVRADSLLRQIFYNLIDNSLVHGKKVTEIRLSHIVGAGGVQLTYQDNGIGIPMEFKSKIFDEGFTSGKGTGYGLFIVEKICKVYGWDIREIGSEGQGAKFVISIPEVTRQ